MPIRPDLPAGLNLSRRINPPVKLPKMTFPVAGGMDPSHALHDDGVEGTVPYQTEAPRMTAPSHQAPVAQEQPHHQAPFAPQAPAAMPAAQPAPQQSMSEGGRVVVYGRSGSPATVEAVQDLIARRVCFVYHDVDRDAQAMQNLKSICAGHVVVPVIVHIGGSGAG